MIKIITKVCIDCGEEKALKEFPTYKSRKGEKMYKNQCKVCNSLYKKTHYEKNKQPYLKRSKEQRLKDPESYKEYLKDYYKNNRDTLLKKNKEYAHNNSEVRAKCASNYRSQSSNKLKAEARKFVRMAIKFGVIIKPNSCSKCGSKVCIEAHHKDYSKPLEVDWLCKTCHENEHHLNEGHDSCVIAVEKITH